MRRGALALTVTAGILAGTGGIAATAAWASDTASRGMHDRMADMSSMDMSSMDMGSMDMSAMAAMHTPEMEALHEEMLAAMPAEARAACETAHNRMTGANGAMQNHTAHHDE